MQPEVKDILITAEVIAGRLDVLATQLTQAYSGKELTVIAVLNGSLIFAADLLRRIPLPLRLASLGVSSYYGGTTSSGTVTFDQLKLPDVNGRHVLILDDILDSGHTLHAICSKLHKETQPASIRTCVLLSKNKERAQPMEADYVGFQINDEFVVGYGLDYQELYRNLPHIGVLG